MPPPAVSSRRLSKAARLRIEARGDNSGLNPSLTLDKPGRADVKIEPVSKQHRAEVKSIVPMGLGGKSSDSSQGSNCPGGSPSSLYVHGYRLIDASGRPTSGKAERPHTLTLQVCGSEPPSARSRIVGSFKSVRCQSFITSFDKPNDFTSYLKQQEN